VDVEVVDAVAVPLAVPGGVAARREVDVGALEGLAVRRLDGKRHGVVRAGRARERLEGLTVHVEVDLPRPAVRRNLADGLDVERVHDAGGAGRAGEHDEQAGHVSPEDT